MLALEIFFEHLSSNEAKHIIINLNTITNMLKKQNNEIVSEALLYQPLS